MRLTGLLAIAAFALTSLAAAQSPPPSQVESTKVAEGSYGSYDYWVLWRTPHGYQVEIQTFWDLSEKGQQFQTLDLTRDFRMRSFRYESADWSALPDGALDCEVQSASLDCISSFRESEGTGSIPVNGAFATQFGAEISLLDIPWFYATMVAHADRGAGKKRPGTILSLHLDTERENNRVRAKTYDSEVEYLGREMVSVLGRRVNAHKYKVTARHYNSTVFTADNGVVLSVDWGGMRLELSRYQQYEDYIAEFRAPQPGEITTAGASASAAPLPAPEPPKARSPAQRVQVKAAEGSFYSVTGDEDQEVSRPIDRWVLWRTNDGYELDITANAFTPRGTIPEFLRLSKNFRINSFKIGNPSWDEQRDGAYECAVEHDLRRSRVNCSSTMWGNEGETTAAIKAPYLFEVNAREPSIDWPWAYANIVNAAPRKLDAAVQLPVLFMSAAEETPGSRDGTPTTKSYEVKYIGREPLRVLRKTIVAHVYDITGEMRVWVADNGMPLQMQRHGESRRWELRRMRQFEPVLPELPVEAAQ